jgi:hypothetical protein
MGISQGKEEMVAGAHSAGPGHSWPSDSFYGIFGGCAFYLRFILI